MVKQELWKEGELYMVAERVRWWDGISQACPPALTPDTANSSIYLFSDSCRVSTNDQSSQSKLLILPYRLLVAEILITLKGRGN